MAIPGAESTSCIRDRTTIELWCVLNLYAGLNEGGDDVQVQVINTQVRGIVVIGWVESLTDL